MFAVHVPSSVSRPPAYHHEFVINQAAATEASITVSSPKMCEIRARFRNPPAIPNQLPLGG